MRSKIVITQWVHPEIIDFLSEFSQVIPNQTKKLLPQKKILELCSDAQAVMVFMPDKIDDSFLSKCSELKIVSAALKGYDNFDVQACSSRGIWFSIVPDLLTDPTAELAIGLLINIARNMNIGNQIVKSGQFNGWRPRLYGKGLDGSTVGIIGMGKVGLAIASRLQGFNTRVLFSDPYREIAPVIGNVPLEKVELSTLLSASDFIVVATPYTPSTLHCINDITLKHIRPDAFLINIGRGSCVDEKAVSNALNNNQLAGYAADVFEFEDWARQDRPKTICESLIHSDRTYFTPHLGSAVDQVRYDIAMQAAVNIKDALFGKAPRDAINNPIKAA
jgi:phosphonate dehydrogenase